MFRSTERKVLVEEVESRGQRRDTRRGGQGLKSWWVKRALVDENVQ